jgi:hypothetical protein
MKVPWEIVMRHFGIVAGDDEELTLFASEHLQWFIVRGV